MIDNVENFKFQNSSNSKLSIILIVKNLKMVGKKNTRPFFILMMKYI